jgi:hypothetical protein
LLGEQRCELVAFRLCFRSFLLFLDDFLLFLCGFNLLCSDFVLETLGFQLPLGVGGGGLLPSSESLIILPREVSNAFQY